METITARAKVFGKMDEYEFQIDGYGTVRVWDEVAGHYTTCHSMSKAQERRIRKLAEEPFDYSVVDGDGSSGQSEWQTPEGWPEQIMAPNHWMALEKLKWMAIREAKACGYGPEDKFTARVYHDNGSESETITI